jgi:DHA1 family inner membrane transport protein
MQFMLQRSRTMRSHIMAVSLSLDDSSVAAAPVAGSRAGLVILALAVGGFAIGTGEFAVMSLLPYFTAALGISAPEGGHVISAYAVGVVVGAPLIAVLAARMARRTLLIALMLIYATGNIASALATDFQTLVAFRFLSGLPHGAYFGVASLLAAAMVPPGRRASAVARVMLGLTVATLVGVPAATWMGQVLGWRWAFALVGALALLTVLLLALFSPRAPAQAGASPLRELGALRTPQVLLTVATGAIGFGGMFAVYTYISPTLTQVTGVAESVVPLVLVVFGLGMIAGNLFGGWAADRALMPAIAFILAWSAASLLLFSFIAGNIWAVTATVFLIGCGGGLGACLQTRLMDVAQDAQTLAAAMNHSALNIANALGPWVGGIAIGAGLGWESTGWVGALLAVAGLAVFLVSWGMERRRR